MVEKWIKLYYFRRAVCCWSLMNALFNERLRKSNWLIKCVLLSIDSENTLILLQKFANLNTRVAFVTDVSFQFSTRISPLESSNLNMRLLSRQTFALYNYLINKLCFHWMITEMINLSSEIRKSNSFSN